MSMLDTWLDQFKVEGPAVALWGKSGREAQRLAQVIPGWQLLAGPLTEPEQAGTIITATAIALHQLLTYSKQARLIVPISQTEMLVPDPAAYSQASTTITKGESISQRVVISRLIEWGYQRHSKTLEPGSLRVRGEQLDIAHPSFVGTYTITWHGPVIESVTQQLDQRRQLTNSLTLPPIKFPAAATPLSQLFPHLHIIRPVNIPPLPATGSSPISYERARELIGELAAGKPVVHADHGIGIYEGLQVRHLDKQEREYLIIRYAAGDSLSVPVEYAHKVSPYIGTTTPIIHRLGGTAWARTRRAAREDAIVFARELLATAQQRQAYQRPAYYIDPALEEKLDTDFAYQLTADQQQTWQEVKKDLQKSEPMDRLVVGDVGFGKTEIAIRAARHIVNNHQQVALLAPTTILVQQHFDTFEARLPELKRKIGLLSRFISAADQKKTRAKIASGELQIIIGTHALLAKDTQWNNLGLIIIDEEQRFGVRQKEHFKRLRATIDMLALSATPIPRTLSMALSGLRHLSLIATPPPGRRHVITHVAKATDKIIREAIEREMTRGGQVYVVTPKISQLAPLREEIAALVPQARLDFAHGQMGGAQLSRVMRAFDGGKLDVLISSSIIENGLDLPNANTMIVMRAPHFGLADLYQLRGRIGRRDREAYAYFLYNQENLSPLQRQRLAALTEASRLGSGWTIARRDLEMRGAGNLLGADQSGTVNAVGVQLYLDMVRQEVDHEGLDLTAPEINIQLPLPALLPASYISTPEERTRWYVRLSRSRPSISSGQVHPLQEHVKNLEQNFGPLPPEAQNLILLLELQHAAQSVGITKISHQKISPLDEPAYERLLIRGQKLPELLQKLSSLGNWVVRKDALTLDVDAITLELLRKLIHSLQ